MGMINIIKIEKKIKKIYLFFDKILIFKTLT